jgi:hypothetical protein
MARQVASRLALHVVLSADKAQEGTKELGNGENGVPDVVVEGAFMELTGEKVIAVWVALFFAVTARGRGGLVDDWEAQFASQQEPVGVGGEAVVREAAWERM